MMKRTAEHQRVQTFLHQQLMMFTLVDPIHSPRTTISNFTTKQSK
jgi:hypothetical protein